MSDSVLLFCFKQKTAYEMRISDWSSDVCSSDLAAAAVARGRNAPARRPGRTGQRPARRSCPCHQERLARRDDGPFDDVVVMRAGHEAGLIRRRCQVHTAFEHRSEEHTSELQSLMRISYAVFCLKKKKTTTLHNSTINHNVPTIPY